MNAEKIIKELVKIVASRNNVNIKIKKITKKKGA